MESPGTLPKRECNFCGATTYYPCSSYKEAEAICGVGALKPSIPSAYTDEAYTKEVYEPHHYAKYEIEPITFIMRNKLPFAVGNVIKYVMRFEDKNGLQDLKKARRYIDMLIEQHYGKESV